MKFKNPDGDLETALRGYSKPLAWKKELWQLDVNNKENNGFQVKLRFLLGNYFFFKYFLLEWRFDCLDENSSFAKFQKTV